MRDHDIKPLSRSDVNVIQIDPVYQGYFRIDRYELEHRRFDGTMSAPVTREVLERGHVAAVLPIDPDRRTVVLVEQFRPGAYAAGWQPWLLECVAGIIEKGESTDDVARRESLEESGCRIQSLKQIHCFLSSPGATSETTTLYVGKTDTSDAGGIHGLIDEGEDIRVHVLPVENAISLLDEGKVVNAKTIIALQWLKSRLAHLDDIF